MSKINQEKLTALKALLNDDSLVNDILGQADYSEKQADSMGIAFKDFDGMSADALLDYAIARKEAEIEASKAKKPRKGMVEDDMDYEDEEEESTEKMGNMYAEKMGEYVTKMGKYVDRMEKMFGEMGDKKTKEADQVAHLVQTQKELREALAKTQAELSALTSEQPPVTSGGYRASRNPDSAVTNKQFGTEVSPNSGGGDPAASWINWVAGAQQHTPSVQ